MTTEQREIIKKWDEVLKQCEMLLSEREFNIYSTTDTIEVSSLSDSKGTIVKGAGVMCNCTTEEVLRIFLIEDDEERAKFDKATKSISELEQFKVDGKAFSIKQYILNSPGFLIAERDFVYVEHIKTIGNVTILMGTSVDGLYPEDKIPQFNGMVRGTTYFNFLKLTQLENGDLQYITLSQGNPNGHIPLALSNAFVYDRPKLMVTVAEQVLHKKCKQQ